MVSRADDAIRRARNVVLIGSGSSVFIDIVADMIGECGFEVTTPAPTEPPWLSVTRTQPVLVICDGMGPELNTKRLIVEAVARGLPLLIVAALHEEVTARVGPLSDRVAWLEFPIARDRFRTTIDGLMIPRRTIIRRNLTLKGAGVTIEAGITARTLGTGRTATPPQ